MVVEMISQLFQLVRNGAFDHAAMFGHLVQARLLGMKTTFRDGVIVPPPHEAIDEVALFPHPFLAAHDMPDRQGGMLVLGCHRSISSLERPQALRPNPP